MKRTALVILCLFGVFGLLAAGCGGGAKAADVPNAKRVKRKAWKDMTKDEKINFINHTPMPDQAKQRQIEAIKAGRA